MVYYVSNALFCVLQVLFLFFNLNAKINKIFTFFILFVPLTALGLSQRIITFISPVFLVAAAWLIFAVTTFLVFNNSSKEKLFVIGVDIAISYAAAIMTAVLGFVLNDDVQLSTLPLSVFNLSLTMVLMLLFTLIRKKLVFSNYNITIFSVVFITQMLFAEVTGLFLSYGGNPFSPSPPSMDSDRINIYAVIVIAVAVVFYVVSDIILFVMMRKLSQSEKTKEELRFREYKNQMNLDYYKSVEKNAEETRKLRHDMANILQVASSLIDGDKKDKETSEQILSQIRREISEIRLEKYTENSLVNAIVSNKAAVCREKGISYDFDIRIPKEIGIDEIDVCKAYVNIIDNAINAVLPLPNEKKTIEIKSFIETGNLYISSKNYCSEEKTKEKKPSSEHGYGQKILKSIAEKYNGKFLTEQTDNFYTALFVINI